MKPALHRSLTFWCGLLMMLFVCWAWQDSFSRVTRIAKGDHGIESVAGGLMIGRCPLGSPFAFERADMSVSRASGFTNPFPAPHFLTNSDARSQDAFADMPHGPANLRQLSILVLSMFPPGSWILLIPYWLIVLAVAAVWLALLVWRARRRRSIPATADAP